jgi:hypothetical protein
MAPHFRGGPVQVWRTESASQAADVTGRIRIAVLLFCHPIPADEAEHITALLLHFYESKESLVFAAKRISSVNDQGVVSGTLVGPQDILVGIKRLIDEHLNQSII